MNEFKSTSAAPLPIYSFFSWERNKRWSVFGNRMGNGQPFLLNVKFTTIICRHSARKMWKLCRKIINHPLKKILTSCLCYSTEDLRGPYVGREKGRRHLLDPPEKVWIRASSSFFFPSVDFGKSSPNMARKFKALRTESSLAQGNIGLSSWLHFIALLPPVTFGFQTETSFEVL